MSKSSKLLGDHLIRIAFLVLGFILIIVPFFESYTGKLELNFGYVIVGLILLFLGGFFNEVKGVIKSGNFNFEVGSKLLLWFKIQSQMILDPNSRLLEGLGISTDSPGEELAPKEFNGFTLFMARIWDKVSKCMEVDK